MIINIKNYTWNRTASTSSTAIRSIHLISILYMRLPALISHKKKTRGAQNWTKILQVCPRQLAKNSSSPSLNLTCPSAEWNISSKRKQILCKQITKSCLQSANCSANHHCTSTDFVKPSACPQQPNETRSSQIFGLRRSDGADFETLTYMLKTGNVDILYIW